MVRLRTTDGNSAAASVSYRLSETVAVYPITPASPMGEYADAAAASGRPNLWGSVPEVVEMQSEAGAAGALHGAALRGALATSFTASQGLLLMIPNMYKIAGELLPVVLHVAARTVATHALSIFGDHSDVMAVRQTGWAMLAAASVQEAADFAAVAHAASLASRVPFVHFFDGFRTSHEVNRIEQLGDEVLAALVDEDDVAAHRLRGLDPSRPQLRGSAQNPDVFFQAREAASPFHRAVPGIVQASLDRLADLTGRRYGLVDYCGAPDAEAVIVMMGSGSAAAAAAVRHLCAAGDKVGLVQIRLYRPFPEAAFLAALPDTVRAVAVLDRTKEPGATGEPLYLDTVATLAGAGRLGRTVVGGRYGLASKEFTPAMAAAVFTELARPDTRRGFTVGINDDVTRTSLPVAADFSTDNARVRAVFFGLGSDGTVGANKATVDIIAELTGLHGQGYFVYDSKKSGSQTVSHLRFDPEPIDSPYLIDRATFVGVHQFRFLHRHEVLSAAVEGATVLLDSPYGPGGTWNRLPREVQQSVLDRDLDVWVTDASAAVREAGLEGRVGTAMAVCFLALSGLVSRDEAVAAVKRWIQAEFRLRGAAVVTANLAAVDAALGSLTRLDHPAAVTATEGRTSPAIDDDREFVRRVTARLLAGEGELLPVSAMAPDGVFPTGTSRLEKRTIAKQIPVWDPDLCIDCARCAIVCPHATIRVKVLDPDVLQSAAPPPVFQHKPMRAAEHRAMRFALAVAPDDCTGCGVCVDVCPAKSKEVVRHKAIDMVPIEPVLATARVQWRFFESVETVGADVLDPTTVKGSQARTPLFEFSGACAGCGETPYLKLLTQLFGDHTVVANATGCSSIYGGNLPTTPWTTGPDGYGPAWVNSLFEDNAEVGLGLVVAVEHQRDEARRLVTSMSGVIGDRLAGDLLAPLSPATTVASDVARCRRAVAELDDVLAREDTPEATRLRSLSHALVPTSVWVVGGDGWAYDIGAGGLDHLLASGRDVNVLVLDTEVYSNTGGQASKATPRGAMAKFATSGKRTAKKDLALEAIAYGDVYVATVAMGANERQAVTAFAEAAAWPGPSLIIAYSTCIAHGIDMSKSMAHQRDAVRSGHWNLFRYHPGTDPHTRPFHLDSREPVLDFADFAASEARWAMLARSDPERARELIREAKADIVERRRHYSQLAGLERSIDAADMHLADEGESGDLQ